MHNELTAIIEQDEQWYIAYCPEIPGANLGEHAGSPLQPRNFVIFCKGIPPRKPDMVLGQRLAPTMRMVCRGNPLWLPLCLVVALMYSLSFLLSKWLGYAAHRLNAKPVQHQYWRFCLEVHSLWALSLA